MCITKLASIVIVTLGLAAPSRADFISATFSGVITSASFGPGLSPPDVDPGDPFSGQITIDTSTAQLQANGSTQYFIYRYGVDVGNFRAETLGGGGYLDISNMNGMFAFATVGGFIPGVPYDLQLNISGGENSGTASFVFIGGGPGPGGITPAPSGEASGVITSFIPGAGLVPDSGKTILLLAIGWIGIGLVRCNLRERGC